MRAAFRLSAFAGIVDDERIEKRHVTEQRIGCAIGRRSKALPGKPFECTVRAEVDHGVCTPALIQPSVERSVVMARREIGRVIHRLLIESESSRGLDSNEDISKGNAAEQVVGVVSMWLMQR